MQQVHNITMHTGCSDKLLILSYTCMFHPQAGNSRQHKNTSASTIPTTPSIQTQPDHAHSQPPDHTYQPHSTYDNILKTLALLEEAPSPLANPNKHSTHDSQSHLNTSGYYLSVDNVNKLDSLSGKGPSLTGAGENVTDPVLAGAGITRTSGGLSESKLQSILSYLDEMDKADQTLLSEMSKTRSRPKTEALPTPRTASVSLMSTAGSVDKTKVKQPLTRNGDTKGDGK